MKTINFVLMGYVMFCSMSFGASNTSQEEGIDSRKDKARRIYDEVKPGIVYGKVVDQFNQPVPDVQVIVSWHGLGNLIGLIRRYHEDVVTTDREGLFTYKYGKTQRICMEARKDGYSKLDSSISESGLAPKSRMDNPIVLTLRKMEEPCFLIVHPYSSNEDKLLWASNGETKLVKVDFIDVDSHRRADKRLEYTDLQVETSFSDKEGQWRVIFCIQNEGDGLMLTNSLSYVAPVSGYHEEEVLFISSKSQEKTYYLYLKTRDPAVYSRMKITTDSWNDHVKGYSLRVYYKQWTNPTGSRILEEDPALDIFTYKELQKEGVEAILSKKLMPKPDVPQRAKQNYERRYAKDPELYEELKKRRADKEKMINKFK